MRRAFALVLASLLVLGCGSSDTPDNPVDASTGIDGQPTIDGPGTTIDAPGEAIDAEPLSDAPPAAPVGAACTGAADCVGDMCLTEAGYGMPGGYCTQLDCDLGDPEGSCLPYGGDGVCLDAGEPGAPFGVCFDRCDPAAPDCRAEYFCMDLGGGYGICYPAPVCGNGTVETGEECDPPDGTTCGDDCTGLGTAPVGDPCGSELDCAGDYCIPAPDWPDGYCTQLDCDVTDPYGGCAGYGGDALCLDISDTGTPFGACFDRCDPAAPDCRTGYECQAVATGIGVCVPIPPAPVCGDGVVDYPEECEPPGTATCDDFCMGLGTAPIGDPCDGAADCLGDHCFAAPDWPAGYCSELECDLAAPDTSCLAFGGDGVCIDFGDPGAPFGVCLDRCDPSAPDCRAGYLCYGSGTDGICYPAPVCGDGIVEYPEECDPPDGTTCDASCVGLGTAPIGDPCTGAADCLGDYCFAAADGWPLGYCSELECDLAAADTSCLVFGGDGVCIDFGDPGAPLGVCLDRCDPGAPTCRTGYFCYPMSATDGICYPLPPCGDGVIDYPEECDPPNGTTCDASCMGMGTTPVGGPCADVTECLGDMCIAAADGWPGGYCSQGNCDLAAPDTSCLPYGGDGICLDAGGTTPYGVCFDQCTPGISPSGCREPDYLCMDLGGGTGICYPAPVCGDGTVEYPEECEPPGTATCDANCMGLGTAPVGAACTMTGDCLGDYCITEAADGWPGGYCTELECDTTAPWTACLAFGGDALCLDVSGGTGTPYGMCLDQCAVATPDCRTGYECMDVSGVGIGVCYPLSTAVCGDGVVEGGEQCDPPDGVTCDTGCQLITSAGIGEPCTADADCTGDDCLTAADGYPDGYCIQTGCDLADPDASCAAYGGDGVCVDDATYGAICMDRCTPAPGSCRTGYTCTNTPTGRACMP